MSFEEAKIRKQELNNMVDMHSKALQQFEVNSMGLVPDDVRATPEYQKAQQDFNRSFAELRNFNTWFVKEFRKKKK